MDDSQKAAEIYVFPDQPRHQLSATAKFISESEVLEYIDGTVLGVQESTLVTRSKEGEERITMPADVRPTCSFRRPSLISRPVKRR
jgi:hypothetical protein